MRLVRFGEPGAERPGVADENGTIRDASAVTADYDAAFFAGDGMRRLAEAAAGELPAVADGVRLGAPVAQPGKVVCVGLNYADHAAEGGFDPPAEPPLFFKAPDAVIGPRDTVLIPPGSERTDWEVELGIVIGRTTRYLAGPGDAAAHVAGFVLSNDVSERAYQLERGGQWVKGKSCETFNPLGPWLVTPDEIADPGSLPIWLDLNGERMQDSNTSEMLFSWDYLIWYVSQFMVLRPGDLLNTGTPAGVGMARSRYLREGDELTLGIDGLGEQRLTCRDATA